jgi:hypothetical protein
MENRWWEYYTVRYFVGTVVGAVIMVLLTGQSGASYARFLATLVDFKESAFLGVSLVAGLGFAFCYIASAPVLTLHTTRAHLQLSVMKKHWLVHAVSIIVSICVAIYVAWCYISPIAAIVLGVILGSQVGLIVAMFATKFSCIEKYYRDLATARSKALVKEGVPASPGMEYITSYRHLREHGNAFSIVLLELVLAWSLYQLCSATEAFYLLFVWLLPAAITWVVGTILESRYVASPLPQDG